MECVPVEIFEAQLHMIQDRLLCLTWLEQEFWVKSTQEVLPNINNYVILCSLFDWCSVPNSNDRFHAEGTLSVSRK